MDALMLLLFCFVIVVCLLIGFYIYYYNKIQDYVIKINEVESVIDSNLRNKYDSVNKCVSIVKSDEEINKEIDQKMFEELVKLRNRKISNFDLDRKLIEANEQFHTLKEKYSSLQENEEIKKISKKIKEYDERLDVNREYYNKCIAEYNKLIKFFPTNIIARLCKYEEKLFFDRKDMSDNDFNDFKF